MQNSIRDADYLPFLGHISPRMSGRLENTSSEVVASNRTSVYEGSPHLRMRTTEKFGNYGDVFQTTSFAKGVYC